MYSDHDNDNDNDLLLSDLMMFYVMLLLGAVAARFICCHFMLKLFLLILNSLSSIWKLS